MCAVEEKNPWWDGTGGDFFIMFSTHHFTSPHTEFVRGVSGSGGGGGSVGFMKDTKEEHRRQETKALVCGGLKKKDK